MNTNYTETTRIVNSGFFLNEQELRRLIDVVTEQFEKIAEGSKVKFKFLTKIFNGLVVESDSLEYVLKSENIGSSQIVEIEIKAYNELTNDEILISFNNNFSEHSFEVKALKYSIKSKNRDWALISSSLIDDRLNKISKSHFWLKLVGKSPIIIFAISMIGLLSYLTFNMSSDSTENNTAIVLKSLEAKINKNENVDIIKSIIEIEKSKLQVNKRGSSSGSFKYLMWIMIIGTTLIISSEYLKKGFRKYFPTRIFYWGDYVSSYDKMIKRRNIVLGFIFITIFVSMIINLLSNLLWDKISN